MTVKRFYIKLVMFRGDYYFTYSSIQFIRKSILQAVRYFISQALQIASPYQRGNKNFTMFQFYWVKDRDLDFFGHDNVSKIDAVYFAF